MQQQQQRDEIIDKDEVLKMARQTLSISCQYGSEWEATTEDLQDFAKLVASAASAKAVEREREACAKVAEATARMVLALLNVTSQPKHIASAIRARGETT